jgi:hypothetical protein
MKRSELKEAIKSEIKSVLSENRYDINDPNSPLGRLNDEYESSGLKGIVDKYGLDVVLMMLSSGEYGDRLNEAMSDEEREDKLQQAKRGGGKEKPLRKLAAIGKKSDEEELKEAMFNEDAVLEDVMLAIDLHLDGQIDYNEMSRRVENLISGKIKPDFKVMNEGTWSVGTKEQIGNFIKDVEKIKIHYNDIVGDDEVYNGLDSAVFRAEEMMEMVAENKSDLREKEMTDAEKRKAAEKDAKKEKKFASKQKEAEDLKTKIEDKKAEMVKKAKEYKAAEGEKKEKIKDQLKKMTAERDELNKQLEKLKRVEI